MEYAIHTLLVRTAHAQQNYLRPYLKKLGLSPGQPKVLRCLTALGPCSQKTLADYCEVDPAAICRMLDSMERDGFLRRQPSKTDRRSGEVVLTDKGQDTFTRWEAQCMTLQDAMLRGFTVEERRQLADFLARAYENVGGRMLSSGEEESSCRT